MDNKGVWKIAPAFDLNYVYDSGVARNHQMTLNGKFDDFTWKDFVKTGVAIGLKLKQITSIIENINAVKNNFITMGLI